MQHQHTDIRLPDPRRVPYYTPCLFAVAYEKMRAEGHQIFHLSLLSSLQLLSIATYTPAFEARPPQVSIWKARRFLGYDRWFDHMGVSEETIEYGDIQTGMDELRRSLAAGQVAITSGTTYWLPYSPDYRSAKYLARYPNPFLGITNHWLLVCAMGQDEVVVYDPIPHQYAGGVPLAGFAQFWEGDRSIAELAHVPGIEKLRIFGCLNLRYTAPLTYEGTADLAIRSLLTSAREYLHGSAAIDDGAPCWYGGRADYELLADLRAHGAQPLAAHRAAYTTCVFEMMFSRYFFRDLLQALAEAHQQPFRGWLEDYQRIVQVWEKAGRLLKLYTARNTLGEALVRSLADELTEAVDAEHAFHLDLCHRFEHVASLARREPAA